MKNLYTTVEPALLKHLSLKQSVCTRFNRGFHARNLYSMWYCLIRWMMRLQAENLAASTIFEYMSNKFTHIPLINCLGVRNGESSVQITAFSYTSAPTFSYKQDYGYTDKTCRNVNVRFVITIITVVLCPNRFEFLV